MSLSNSLGLLGRKVGMMRLFTDDGDAVPVTVVDVSNNRVTQVKTQENDGYVALQVTFGSRKASRVTKPQAGHLAKAGVEAGEIIQEFRVTAETAASQVRRGRHGARRRRVRRRPEGRRAGHVDRQGLRRHDQAPPHEVAARVARQQPFAQRARLHRHGAGSGPRVPRQAHDGPPGRRHRHHPEPRRHPHRRSPPAAADQGRRSRLQGRLRHRASGRQGQAASALRRERSNATRTPERTRPGRVEVRRARDRVRP